MPMSQEQIDTIPQLLFLIAETLGALSSRVRFINVAQIGATDEQKAQFNWCVAIGILAHDIGSTMPVLIEREHLRAAKILNRSLFEYRLSLNVYREASSRALDDAADAPKALRRFFESTPLDKDELSFTQEEFAEYEDFVKKNAGKPRSRNIVDDLRLIHRGDEPRVLNNYLGFYGFASAFAHGGPLIFKDAFFVDDADEIMLAWKSPYLTAFSTITETFVFLIDVLQAIEAISDRSGAHAAIMRKYFKAVEPVIASSRTRPSHY